MRARVDVAVLGAGLAGSSAAKALADNGWETLLLDQKSFPRHKVCGEFLSPESQSTMRALGIYESVSGLGHSELERIKLIFENGAETEIILPSKAWGISRYSLDSALHYAALQAGAELQTSTTVTAVRETAHGYSIETKQGSRSDVIEARAVIAAWGSSRRAGLPGNQSVPARKAAYIGVKSHFQGITMEPVVELYFFRGGYLGLCPVEGGLVNASALLEKEMAAKAGKSILSILDGAAQRNAKLYEKLKYAEPVPGAQAAVAPVYLNRKPMAWDRLPLLGDSAAMIPPLCGDGMSMALRSAALCVPLADGFLRGQLSLADWQQAYTRSINEEFIGPLRWGGFLQWLFEMPAAATWLPDAARLAPGLAKALFQATRIKPYRV